MSFPSCREAPKLWQGSKMLAPHFEYEIASLQKWPFSAGFWPFLAQFFYCGSLLWANHVYFAQKMSPDVFSWLTFHTPLKKGPHRLLNWQIQVTRVSWLGQSTRGGGCIQNLANYASLMALWLSSPAQTHFESDHCGDRSTQFSSLLNRKHEG